MTKMYSGKAPGEDGIPPEVYKHGGDELAAELTRLFRDIWAEGLPTGLQRCIDYSPLQKPG